MAAPAVGRRAAAPGQVADGRSLYLRPWRIDLTVRDGVPRLVPAAALARIVARALAAGGAPRPASIGLILSNDGELAELNAAHMGKAGPTDVLSFPLLDPTAYPAHPGGPGRGPTPAVPTSAAATPAVTAFALPPGARPHLGDIVVSVERAIAQATEGRGGWLGNRRWSPTDELRLLVVHGTLHVCGWDHAEPLEESAMRNLEATLLDG